MNKTTTIQLQRRLFTVSEYHRLIEAGILTEQDRVELIDGEIVAMSPISSRHAGCVNRLIAVFSRQVNQEAVVSAQNPISLQPHSEPEPDLMLLRPRPDFYGDSHPQPEDVLLLVEVAETSAAYDREVKLPLYAQAGIAEVWLIDLAAEEVAVYRQPQPQGYGLIQRFWPGQSLSVQALPSLSVTVDEVLG